MKKWKIGKGHKVGVIGLGGIGHMAVKFASSFGAEVIVLSTSPSKQQDAWKLGAQNFFLSTDEFQMARFANYFDYLIDTVSSPHYYNKFLEMLKTDGTMICLGSPSEPTLI